MENFIIAILIIMGLLAIPILVLFIGFIARAIIGAIDEIRSWF